MSKKQIVVPTEKYIFTIFEGIGPQLLFQILSWTKRADPCLGVCPNSAWSPSYKKIVLEIAEIWTTTVDGVLLGYYKGLLGNTRERRQHVFQNQPRIISWSRLDSSVNEGRSTRHDVEPSSFVSNLRQAIDISLSRRKPAFGLAQAVLAVLQVVCTIVCEIVSCNCFAPIKAFKTI